MSFTTVYVAGESGDFLPVLVFHNAWGSAARVWSALSKAYFGDESHWLRFAGNDEKQRKFWDLCIDPNVPRCDRAAMLWTFDRIVAEGDRLAELAELLRAFDRSYPTMGVNHLPAVADLYEALADPSSAASVEAGLTAPPQAVAVHQTSVAECPWLVPDRADEEGEKLKPYNLAMARHGWLFASLDEEDEEDESEAAITEDSDDPERGARAERPGEDG